MLYTMNTFYNRNWVLTVLTCISAVGTTLAQAVLPTSFGFDGATPVGWTLNLGTNGNLTYTFGQAGLSCRLDADNENVALFFAEEPGALTYYIRGSVGGGTPAWSGDFEVQESVDGTTWSTMRAFTNNELSVAEFAMFTDNPQPETRYVRWFYVDKVSGANVALDEITLATPAAGDEQEINVKRGADNVPSGSEVITGNTPSSVFSIENLGLTADLEITSIQLSGPDAADFSLFSIPLAVAAGNSADFTLNFNGTGGGSRFCTITINNNDASESAYTINIYAIAGEVASEPTAQSGALSFANVSAWDFNVAFAAGNPVADGYLVLRKKGAPVTEIPTDGQTYNRGEWIGGSQITYIGNAGSHNARNIDASTAYHYAVFAFNGPAGYQNYLATAPSAASVVTLGANIGNTYQSVLNSQANFVTSLHAAISPANYFQIFYGNYASSIVADYYVKDTTINGEFHNAVECQYSGDHFTYDANFVWWDGNGPGRLSREHSFPQSWMPTYFVAGFDDTEPVSDLHSLFPVLQEECNAVRSNFPYGEVVAPSNSYLSTQFGANANGQDVYEMRDEFKGNAARGVMYLATRYTTPAEDFSFPETISLIIPYGQDENLVKQWHFNDLPDNGEVARNEYVFSRQNNRNPFVDSVAFPCYIRFINMAKFEPVVTFANQTLTSFDPGLSYQWFLNGSPIQNATERTYVPTENGNYSVRIQQFEQCPAFTSAATSVTVISVNELSAEQLSSVVYPNPNKGAFFLTLHSDVSTIAQVRVTDVNGREVHTFTRNIPTGDTQWVIDEPFAPGVYLVQAITERGAVTTRMVVE
jgi:hypothetical protein